MCENTRGGSHSELFGADTQCFAMRNCVKTNMCVNDNKLQCLVSITLQLQIFQYLKLLVVKIDFKNIVKMEI